MEKPHRERIEILLNPKQKLPGYDPKTPFRLWLARLRITMLEKLSVNMIVGVEAIRNDSVITYGDLVNRLSGFIVADNIKELEINETAPSDRSLEIFSDMFAPEGAIIEGVHLTTLPPGGSLHVKAYARDCSYEEDDRALCTPVVAVGFYEPENRPGAFVFFYEAKAGIKDPEKIYYDAIKLMDHQPGVKATNDRNPRRTPKASTRAGSSRTVELPGEHTATAEDVDIGLNETVVGELEDLLDF